MNNLNICFDIDNSCFHIQRQFLHHVNKLCKEINPDHINIDELGQKRFDITKDFGISEDIVWNAAGFVYDEWENTPIMEGVKETLETLYLMTAQPITFITDRPKFGIQQTYSLLNKHFDFPFIIIFPVVCGYRKVDYVRRNFTAIYEDRRKHALEMAHAGIKIFMKKYPYNAFDGVYRKNLHKNIHWVDAMPEIIQSSRNLSIVLN